MGAEMTERPGGGAIPNIKDYVKGYGRARAQIPTVGTERPTARYKSRLSLYAARRFKGYDVRGGPTARAAR